MKKHLPTSGFTPPIEFMNIIANSAAVAIRQYFRSIQIAGAPSVVGQFRTAAGALAAVHAAADGGHLAI